ncbi:hypothetical protein THAR02_11185 [Trichoderma harzianum]|uniref:Zn(2)-C6 fungal-type domain-containing protein n=1 Tax=Trichoderma harzianum TaxID=5544 RepID=A0A0F9X7B2_TRIHA|nr:hypothetical protein THAR02_11185 [Trichoderma harzianum]
MEHIRNTITSASIREELRDRQRARNRGSCLPCRERKVRCNRQHPCLTCTKRGDTDLCIYSESCTASEAQSQPIQTSSSREPYRPLSRQSPRSTSELKSTAQKLSPPKGLANPSPAGGALLQGYSLITLADGYGEKACIDDTNCPDVLEDAIAPLLGIGEQERTTCDRENSLASSVYTTLPVDEELIQLFTAFRLRIHPFQPVIDDLDTLERLMCGVITQRSFSDDAYCPPELSTPRDVVRFLCLLHAVLAAGAQFSDQPVEQRIEASRKHERYAFGLLKVSNALFTPFKEALQALLILGHVLQNNGYPQAAWMLGGTTIRMAVSLGVHTTSRNACRDSDSGSQSSRNLRLAIVWQDALLSIAFNRAPSSHEMDLVDDLPPFGQVRSRDMPGLSYKQAMSWICHLVLKHWKPLTSQQNALGMDSFRLLFDDLEKWDQSLQDHLRERTSCHSAQAIKEHYTLELHRNFCLSSFCRPILMKRVHRNLTNGEVAIILRRLGDALKRSVKAFIHLHSVSSMANRSWASLHNAIASALLLSVTEDLRDEESGKLQERLVQSLTVKGLSGQLSDVRQRSLRALQSLERMEKNTEGKKRADVAESVPNFLQEQPCPDLAQNAINNIMDLGFTEFDESFQSYDFSCVLPLDTFDQTIPDLGSPGNNFGSFL